MKASSLVSTTFLISVALVGINANAGFFDNLKNNVINSTNQAANDAVNQTISDTLGSASPNSTSNNNSGYQGNHPSYPQSATHNYGPGPDMSGGPSANLTGMTVCAGLPMTNVMVGKIGEYSITQGLSTVTYQGLINRQPGQVTGCILPSLNSMEVAYVEVDTQKLNAMGGKHAFDMQCVESDHPEKGAIDIKDDYAYSVNSVSPKDLMLHCGHSVSGVDTGECASGSNATRSAAWDDLLKQRGTTMLTVRATQGYHAPPQGDKVYCQFYNKNTGTSLFGIEYQRTKS